MFDTNTEEEEEVRNTSEQLLATEHAKKKGITMISNFKSCAATNFSV